MFCKKQSLIERKKIFLEGVTADLFYTLF